MNLALPPAPAHYKSASQRARVSTEPWALENLFCPSCPSPRLEATSTGTEAIDFTCPSCDELFQLKSQSRKLGRRIVDAEFNAMIRAIRRDATPNIFAMHYDSEVWRVVNVVLLPRFAFSESAIEKRPPLGPHTRRAGWVGCYIVLDAFSANTRIPLVSNGTPAAQAEVRSRFKELSQLSRFSTTKRGWTLDVLRAVEDLRKQEFSLEEAYSREARLASLHPANRHIRPKIRQQLQVLRDLGFVKFLGGGRYRLI